MRTLHVSDRLRDEIVAEARRTYPTEACGLLVGLASAARAEVVRIEGTPNRASRPDRYSIDPLDQLAVEAAARRDGLQVVGVWHSHPDRAPEPSRADLEEAWEGLSYLIVSLRPGGPAELRSWQLCDGVFREERVKRRDPAN